jgi:quercetin dioxygenase-like cupin family protein
MEIDALPSIDDDGVDWRPIQHYFGLTAFGINVYRAAEAGTQVIGDHDERPGRHEEVYLVLEGRVRFTIGDESFECGRGTLVVIKDPEVRRGATAETAGAAVLAVGNRQAERFESTWQPHHFEGVPTYDAT